jgi:hypothetical protein
LIGILAFSVQLEHIQHNCILLIFIFVLFCFVLFVLIDCLFVVTMFAENPLFDEGGIALSKALPLSKVTVLSLNGIHSPTTQKMILFFFRQPK